MSLSNRKLVSDDAKVNAGAQTRYEGEERSVKYAKVEQGARSYVASSSSLSSFSYSPMMSLGASTHLYRPCLPPYFFADSPPTAFMSVMPPLPPIPTAAASTSSSSSALDLPPLPPIPDAKVIVTPFFIMPPLPPIPEPEVVVPLSKGLVESALKKDEKSTQKAASPKKSKPLTHFVADNKSKKQKGWNCFDVAVGIERSKLVEFALKNADEFGFRQLLLHDIKSAALNTVVFLDEKAAYEKTNKPNPRKRKYGTMNLADVLPKAMHTQELVASGKAYDASVDQLNKGLCVCNKALGFEGVVMDAPALAEYFKLPENSKCAAYAVYRQFLRNNQACFAKIKAFDDYLMSPEVYSAYIQYYFGANKWFTIIPDSNSGRGSSMLDVASRYIQSQIIIYCKKKNNAGVLEYTPIAKTDLLPEYKGQQKHVEYVGNNHFCELVPAQAPAVVSQAVGLTLFRSVVAVASASAVSSAEEKAQKKHIPMSKKSGK